MNNLVIVAIPKEDDYVNKISSEKVPHLTLLFLGDMSNVKNLKGVIDFTQHAANQTLARFGLEVDRRGVLGPDLADVLFFSKSQWSGFDIINNFRNNLLKNDTIRTLYDSTEQFENWVPHLTLGYPISPAKSDDRDYPGITYVNFDRIAIWDKEYEGYEIPLKAYDFNDGLLNSISHSSTPYDPVKAHEYYIRTRHLKGRHKGTKVSGNKDLGRHKSSSYTIEKNGKTYVLSAAQLAEQRAYAEMRVAKIEAKLSELGKHLHELMRKAQKSRAHSQTQGTSSARARRARQSKKYQQRHAATLAAKAKTRRQVLSSVKKSSTKSHKDPVATLQGKITEVRNHLKAAVATQRALASAKQNG